MNYFWASFQTFLENGDSFGFNFGDGIASQITTLDRASEDFAIYQGKACKLGVTKLDENIEDIMSHKHFVTSKKNS